VSPFGSNNGFGIDEVPYEPEVRKRHQLIIAALTIGGAALILLVPTYTTWPFKNAIAITGIWLVFCACLYWMFASKKAGRLDVSVSMNRLRRMMHGG
jgi:hypothetical protein